MKSCYAIAYSYPVKAKVSKNILCRVLRAGLPEKTFKKNLERKGKITIVGGGVRKAFEYLVQEERVCRKQLVR